jgi:tetratricopeptide (TPR) repeat protein/arylsulfatase A-like enzyme
MSEMAAPTRLAKRVLLIGWDAADWKIINPLLDAGLMPTLDSFVNRGVMGNLATLQPILSPMLWNSIATGQRAYKHGIHGFVEIKPDGTGIRPSMSTSRKVKALWNILSQNGLKSQVFDWFASHPAEPINGVCVSNLFHQGPASFEGEWRLAANSVHPRRLEETLKALRVHPTEIEGCHLQPFIPRAAEIDQKDQAGRKVLARAATALSECATVHAAATWAMEHEPWDFCAIYYNAIDRFCHDFMPFHPPRHDMTEDRWVELLGDVVNGIYRFHDIMLERLLQLAGDDTTVMIVSDHGFHSDHLRPREAPGRPAGPVAWHRPYGIFAMRGPGVLADERVYGASILDVAPTVLTLFGLPIGQDMDGKPLLDAFVETPLVERIPTWENVPGDAGLNPPEAAAESSEATEQALQQLVDLGYVEPLSDQEKNNVTMVRLDSRFNLAISLLDAGLTAEAISIFEALLNERQEDRFALMLAQAYINVGRLPDARRLLEEMVAKRNRPTSESSTDPENGDRPRAPLPRIDMVMGILNFEEGRIDEALTHLERAEAADADLPKLHNHLGYVYLRRRRWTEAERAFNKALEIDGDNPQACHGLAVALLRQDRPAEAAELALRAVGLQHFFPAAHFQLGLILARLNWPERAAQAFETGLRMRPGSIIAHRYLSRLYGRLGQTEKAQWHRAEATKAAASPVNA